MVEKIFYTMYNKMMVSERDRKRSVVFRSINKAELHSVSESPQGHNTTLPARLSKSAKHISC
jgi:hypothetical protein